MAQQALASGTPQNNPGVPSADEIVALYQQVWWKRARITTCPDLLLSGDEAHAFKLQKNLMRAIVYFDVFSFNAEFRVRRHIIRV